MTIYIFDGSSNKLDSYKEKTMFYSVWKILMNWWRQSEGYFSNNGGGGRGGDYEGQWRWWWWIVMEGVVVANLVEVVGSGSGCGGG